jgi:diguanylate cyclase (GGDEF)-like protein/PAS domain S-box-containing protein
MASEGRRSVDLLRVLLVAEDPAAPELVRTALLAEWRGATVVPARDQAGLERALLGESFDIGIVLPDVRFASLAEVRERLRTLRPLLPVVLLSRSPGDETGLWPPEGVFDEHLVFQEPREPLARPVRRLVERARARQALLESETRYQRLFEDVPLGLYRATPAGAFLDVNPALVQMLGFQHPEPLLAVGMPDLYLEPEARAEWEASMARDGAVRNFEARFKRRDGGSVWVEDNSRAIRDEKGVLLHYEGSLADITERRKAADALRSLEKAVENLPIGITISDLDGRIVYTNPTGAKSHGYTVEELLGQEARILVTHADPKPTAATLGDLKPWKRERTSVRKDGSTFPAQLFSDVIMSTTGKPIGIVTTSEDITERKRIEEQLRRNAFYDALTGLPNRAVFLDRLGRALERSRRRRDYVFAVLFIDLDRFKLVNDSFGHMTGDGLLVQTARKLEAAVRPSDTVSRLGGDEFAILADEIHDVSDAVAIAERSQATLAEPVELGGQELFTTASIGIAPGGPNYEHPEDLLRDADIAMYNAKALGKARYEIFDETMHARAKEVMRLDSDLRRAIERGELGLVFQPVASLKTGRVVGAEALLRWNHPQKGELLPEQFVPLAEETGLIVPIGDWVLRNACAAAKGWAAAGHEGTVAVNLSARQFRQPDLASRVKDALAEFGLDPRRLELELTESAVMDDVTESIKVLRQISDMGVGISIDDFGTGYSSLSHIKHFPLRALKVDRAFVQQVAADPREAAIVSSILALGHSLGLLVIAEGVETQEQLRFFVANGCDLVQGSLVGPTAPSLDWSRALDLSR